MVFILFLFINSTASYLYIYFKTIYFTVFKVFSIEEDEFVESLNLRVGKNLNLNFSCNDVAWNINDGIFCFVNCMSYLKYIDFKV